MTIQPIGVLDSGLGGLTVWRELVKMMPNENYLYFGDSGYCPYGAKEPKEILDRVKMIVNLLIENNCKLIVIACNAITASTVDFLRGRYNVPFIGMEPAIKPALLKTKTRSIGVLATKRTLNGTLFVNTRARYGQGIDICEQVGHGLVEKVEALDFDSDATVNILQNLIDPMLKKNIDYLVLGCTHYPFLRPSIEKVLGRGIYILDPAPAVARQTFNVLKKNNLKRNYSKLPGESKFFTTGQKDKMNHLLSKISYDTFRVEFITI